MNGGLRPYPAYRESGLPWLESVPAHWDVRRAKWLFRRMERPVREHDEMVTCFRDGIVTLRRNRRLQGFTESLKEIGYQGIRRGDLVIHGMDAFAGAVGVADSDGKGTPVYAVCEPLGGANAHYYAYVVREMARSQWILALAKGIRERSSDFRFERFATQFLPYPSVDEQAAVVRYLDHIDRRIRRHIRARRKRLVLLEEQWRALVLHAMTHGISGRVCGRSTGSEWFPEMPAHLELLPLRRLIWSAVDGPHFSPSYVDEGVPFLSARNVRADCWSLGDVKYISDEDYAEFSKRVKPQPGDVLYTKGGTTGIARVVDLDFDFQVWVHIAVLKVRKARVSPAFLAAALNSPKCYEQAQLFTRGATNQDLGLGRMKAIVIPVPPLDEQKRIVDKLASDLQDYSRLKATTRREIDLLREFRTRLVSDLVTGRYDVREVAAQLPDEADEPEPLDGLEALSEDDAADGEGDVDAIPEEVEA